MTDSNNKKIKKLEQRILKLEKAVFHYDSSLKKESKNYKGLIGGINFLIDNDFFKILRSKKEVYEELKKEGYYHRPQAVDTILRRDFVGTKKILNRILEDNIWKYGLRK